MRSACWLTELLLLELSELLSSDSSSAGFCGTGASCRCPGVQGLLGAFLLGWCCWGFWRRRFFPLPVGVLKSSFLPPLYSLGLLLQRAGATGVLLLPLTVLPVVLWWGSFPPRSPLLAGRVLPRSAATSRLLCGRPRATAGIALGCLAFVPRSYALPNLATGRLGRSSPDPRPRTASYCAGPTPGRLAARFPLASSSAGLVRWFPTSAETASGLDSSLLLRPSCGTC